MQRFADFVQNGFVRCQILYLNGRDSDSLLQFEVYCFTTGVERGGTHSIDAARVRIPFAATSKLVCLRYLRDTSVHSAV